MPETHKLPQIIHSPFFISSSSHIPLSFGAILDPSSMLILSHKLLRDFVTSYGRHDFSCLQKLIAFLTAKAGLAGGLLKFFSVFVFILLLSFPCQIVYCLASLDRNPKGDSAMNFTHIPFPSFPGISCSWSLLHQAPILGCSFPTLLTLSLLSSI